jgi:hypothetical protein
LRQAWNDTFDRFAEGQNIFLGTPTASETQTAQCKRGGHQFHELPAIDLIQTGCALGEFLRQLGFEARRGGKLI